MIANTLLDNEFEFYNLLSFSLAHIVCVKIVFSFNALIEEYIWL